MAPPSVSESVRDDPRYRATIAAKNGKGTCKSTEWAGETTHHLYLCWLVGWLVGFVKGGVDSKGFGFWKGRGAKVSFPTFIITEISVPIKVFMN